MVPIKGRNLDTAASPLVLVADDEPANLFFVRRTLAAAGWDVVEARNGIDAVRAAEARPPCLILMDIEMPDCDGIEATRQIRAMGAPVGSVPILAYSMRRVSDEIIRSYGMDGRIKKPCAPDALLAAVELWCPAEDVNGSKRLAIEFGHDEIAELVDNLRDQLIEAIARPDTTIAAIAHRIAGVAGTLGFVDVSASWLRLSEGDDTAIDDARRDARIAIAAIDRDRSIER